jgi:lipid-A-disaccharide synthase
MRYFITAGEVSGDIYGGLLMQSIKKIDSSAEFYGFGGEKMTAEGIKSLAPLEKLSVMGIWEVAKQYSWFKKLQRKCKQSMIENKIDIYIPIDYPGFNIPLAKFAQSKNIKVAYYIVPQLWAWGKNRAKKLKYATDVLLPIFPFEVDFYKKYGMEAFTPGHPLLDLPDFSGENIIPVLKRKKQIAFMPGSRMQELDKHLPVLAKVLPTIKLKYPDYLFATALTSKKARLRVESELPSNLEIKYYDSSRDLMKESRFGIIKSGTSNLEAALLGLPFVMIYKLAGLTYFLGKRLVNVDKYSIVNILTGKCTVEEIVQNDFTPENVCSAVSDYLDNHEKLNELQTELLKIRSFLGNSGTSDKAAQIVTKSIN